MAKKKSDPRKENTTSRTKKFVYKRAVFAKEPHSKSLEDHLNEMWDATASTSGKRRQIVDEESQASIVTHYRSRMLEMSFFEIMTFTPGMKALAAKIDFTQPSIDIEHHDITDAKGAKLHLIENLAYVGVSKNHVVLLQSPAMKSPQIETHLNWLLSAASDTLPVGQPVKLANRVPPSLEDDITSAKAIHFSTDLQMGVGDGNGEKRIRPVGSSWEGVKALLRALGGKMADVTDELEVGNLTASTPVEVDIWLKWPQAKKDQRHMLLDRIATGLRHVDSEVDYEIKTANGKVTKGDFLLEKPKAVHHIGERPVRDLLFEAMQEWLSKLQVAGEIAY